MIKYVIVSPFSEQLQIFTGRSAFLLVFGRRLWYDSIIILLTTFCNT